jgi:hypothetical protein
MKLLKLKKLNSLGFSHIIVPLVAIVIIGGIGSWLLGVDHADSVAPVLYLGTGSGRGNVDTTSVNKVTTTLAAGSSTLNVGDPAYSPNHQYIAYSSQVNGQADGTIKIYNTSTKKTVTSPSSPNLEVVGGNGASVPMVWYPSSQKIAFISWNGTTDDTFLYTINADGTGLTKVANVSATAVGGSKSNPLGINSLAVTGDGQYIIYANTQGVYAVMPGTAKSITLNADNDCSAVTSRPTTTETVSYLCNTFNDNTLGLTATLDTQTIGSPAVALLSSKGSDKVGGTANYYGDDAWSYDGSTVAMQLVHTTTQGACNVTNNTEIATVSYATHAETILYTDPANHVTCEGGPGANKAIAWSSDGSQIAYIDNSPTAALDNKLFKIPSKPSTTAITPSLVASYANNLSW